jgi:hypothetical protein
MVNNDTATLSEMRRAKRVIVPLGTTALFLTNYGSLDTTVVQDISVIGLLLSVYNSENKYPINTYIYNIYVDIPPSELSAGNRICFLVDRGKVVRSFFDQVSETFCYGIELIYESSYVKGQIECLVNTI